MAENKKPKILPKQEFELLDQLGQRDSNPRVQESKSCALPLGDGPMHNADSIA